MNKLELIEKLAHIDKELLPLAAKKGKRGPEIERMLNLEAEAEILASKIRAADRKEMWADPKYMAEMVKKHGPIKKVA